MPDLNLRGTRYLLQARPHPKLLSIVIPVYNEERSLPLLQQRLEKFIPELPCAVEIILVNDGSTDASIEFLARWAESDPRISVLNLARNFGHQAAATAGLDQAHGDAVVLMDADLQDPPEVIVPMIAEYCRGYEVVYGRRTSRSGETCFKRGTAWLFYRLMRLLVHSELPADVGDFRLMSRACLDAVCSMRETHRFLRGMVAWVGFPQTAIDYARSPRVAGRTNYSFAKMLWLAWTAAVSFSATPLRLSFVLGLLIAAIGMLEAANAVMRSLLGLYVVPGWSSLIVVTCVIGGSILISIGILGEYVGRIFEAVKTRPLYVIASQVSGAKYPAPWTRDSVAAQLAQLSAHPVEEIPLGVTHAERSNPVLR